MGENSQNEDLVVGATSMGYLQPHAWIAQMYAKIDAEGCNQCKYGCRVDQHWACSYIERVGHSRGCEAGSKCTKFDPKNEYCERRAGEAVAI